jgi:hypothetical protein
LRPVKCFAYPASYKSTERLNTAPPAGHAFGLTEVGMSGILGDVGGFFKGTAEGAWDGAKGMVQGVGHLAQDGYKLATDSHYRAQAWDAAVHDAKAAGNFAETAVTDPAKAADETGHAASGAWHSVQTAYDQAAAHGQGSEFIGKMFGQGAILVGTSVIPAAPRRTRPAPSAMPAAWPNSPATRARRPMRARRPIWVRLPTSPAPPCGPR